MRTFPLLAGMLAALSLGSAAVRAQSDETAPAARLNPHSMKPLATEQWTRDKAAHLLRRAAFGGTPEEIDRCFKIGPDAAVRSLLDYNTVVYEAAEPHIDPVVLEPPERGELQVMSAEERRQYQQKRQMAERRSFEEVRLWWIDRLAHSPRPVEEKLTLFWHGHFTSGMREVKDPVFMKEQNEVLRRKALGNFRDLVLSISKDRAMLVYLDNARNVKRQPNENYARELLELFTLGAGNYSESDIKAAARAFTGWSYDRDGFVFRRDQHDDGEKQFLGRKGKLDGGGVIDIVLEQQACSEFLSRKLLRFFVCPDPPRPLINAFAAVLRRHKYDLRQSLETLFRSEAFYAPEARACLVKSPTELLIGAARQLGMPVADLFGAERALASMGQELLQPPNVKGWDGGQKWINTALLFNRYNYVGALLRGDANKQYRGIRAIAAAEAGENDENSSPGMMAAAQSRLAPRQPQPYDPSSVLRRYELQTPEQIVDFYADNLLAAPLPSIKREQLIDYLRGERNDFSVKRKECGARVLTMLQLLVATPEYQMN